MKSFGQMKTICKYFTLAQGSSCSSTALYQASLYCLVLMPYLIIYVTTLSEQKAQCLEHTNNHIVLWIMLPNPWLVGSKLTARPSDTISN